MRMKERIELAYYVAFMILGIGGLTAGIFDEISGNAMFENYIKYIVIAFLMTVGRFIYNGQHFWNLPSSIGKPSIRLIIGFIGLSAIIVGNIELTL